MVRLLLGSLFLGQCPSARCSALKLQPFLVPWSPALSCVSSSAKGVLLALTNIDGEPGGRLALGPMALGQCLSARFPAPDVLKLRPFLAPWSPALSCVSSSAQVVPPGLKQHSELFQAGRLPGIDRHSEFCHPGHPPGIDWHSELFHPGGPLALTDIDDETGGRLPLGPLFLGQCPSARCSAPGVLKLQPFLTPQCPALSCVSSTTQEGPLALTGIDSETGGSLALGLLFLGQWPPAWCPAPDVLKLRPFLAPWSPALSYVSSSAQAGPMALRDVGFGGREGQWCSVSVLDGEPVGRLVLGPHRPQASVHQPGAHPPVRWSLDPPWHPGLLH
nr:uncharacterized protein LOC129482510 isoform X1 [Symphalangus syndactylus]XP_055134409.1 uncharacterized protein LOC129482510 isoform X1 [Symphalangus syndactylus]XP_055134410.1 uncharacterized protein LOC129482510 isoform X1 [Symphalangus syndactylus]XP_055134411.1 uncharacterized protein LOC129482510 isoform X1 [Symphalangus syndactylus]XP_055134412.1 uncharacterized protein LOC129482510 isoform X1 [Symphalangus syndactylus]XP_055134413.1 uncharacterized protein LOC129482510 isoform X1 [S